MLTQLRTLPTTPTSPSGRSPRRLRRAFAAAALTAIALPVAASAQPPGGPADNPNGATVVAAPKIIVPTSLGGGVVTFSGSGFTVGEVVSVKVDDGKIFPVIPGGPGAANVFTTATAQADGTISGSVDLGNARPEFQAELTSGKHNLRFLSNHLGTARSTHTDFAITTTAVPRPTVGTAKAFVGPADGDAFGAVPEYAHGVNVELPFRVTGFAPDTVVNIKINDDGKLLPPAPVPGAPEPSVWGQFTTDAAGNYAGSLVVPTNVGGTYWLRFLAPGTSVSAPYVVQPAPPAPPAPQPPAPQPPAPQPPTNEQPKPEAPTCPTRPRFNSIIYADGVTSFYYRPLPGQRILGARRLGVKRLQILLETPKGRSTLPRLEYTTEKVVDAKKLPWFARKVGPRRVVTAIMSNADSSAYSGVRLFYQPKRGTYAKLILPNGNVQTLRKDCPKVTGYKTIYAQNIFVSRRSK